MSFRVAIRVAIAVTLLLTPCCGGGVAPPRATLGPERASSETSNFEDLPITRLPRERVPRPDAESPSRGAPQAKVVVQLWSDFECPYCADVQPAIEQLMREYAGRVRLVWRDYPLPFHAHARLAANGGREAFAQGGAEAFWKFHDAIYGSPSGELDKVRLERLASKAGLDPERFSAALGSLRHDAEVSRDLELGTALGVDGTPAFLVNDYLFVGAVPFDILSRVVDQALADSGP